MILVSDAREHVKKAIEQLEKLNLSDAKDSLIKAMVILNHPVLRSIEIAPDTFKRVTEEYRKAAEDKNE
jgi:hypothetical protein